MRCVSACMSPREAAKSGWIRLAAGLLIHGLVGCDRPSNPLLKDTESSKAIERSSLHSPADTVSGHRTAEDALPKDADWAGSSKTPQAVAIATLDTPALYIVPKVGDAPDPLECVAPQIRMRIDPANSAAWPDGFSPDFVDQIRALRSSYHEFWKRIRPEARRYVDLDNDGTKECFVISEGMNDHAWGFHHFLAVLKRSSSEATAVSNRWDLLFFDLLLDGGQALVHAEGERPRFEEFELAVTDLDRDGRPDVLFTTLQIGGSAHARHLNVISMHEDMKIRHHRLWSREPVRVMEPNSLRPVFIQHDEDDWGLPDDCGASVRARGYRKAYYRWTVMDGFVRF